MNKLQELKAELATAKEELSNCGRSKPQFLIDDDDEYQDQLELGWHKDEIRDRIESLEKQIKEVTANNIDDLSVEESVNLAPPLNGDMANEFNDEELGEADYWDGDGTEGFTP